MQLGQSMLFYQQSNNISTPSVFKKISNYVFRFDQKIGQGNFSKVYKGQHQLTNQAVAIKIIELSSIKSPKLQELLFSQIQVIQSLNHPNILKCYEVLRSDHNCYIITELCNGGDLQTLLKKTNFFSEQTAIPYLKNIFQGLFYLSERGIVHRDLKSANIFLHNGVAKIADFGFAKYTNNQTFKDMDIGSPLYMSPEGMIDNIYGMKTDIWSFGIIIYELLHGCNPFGRCQTQYQLKNAVLMPLQNNSFRADISRDVINLIRKCLQINFQARPSAQALLSDPFIKLMLNNGQQPIFQQKKIQWADHIIETHYLEAPQFQIKKHPSSQQRICIDTNQNYSSNNINRSHGMIPKGTDTSFSRNPVSIKISGQSQIRFLQNNLTQTKNSPSRFLNIPQNQNKNRKLSPNNSDSNINYRSSNQTHSISQNISVNDSFSGKSTHLKSAQMTPARKQYQNDTSLMMSNEANKKTQLSGSQNSNDSFASYNQSGSNKKNTSVSNLPRGSYQQNSNGKNVLPQKNLQFLVNQNRLQLQKKQQTKNNHSQSKNDHRNSTLSSNFQQSAPQKIQFSSGKKFGQLIKGQKKAQTTINNQQNTSNNLIPSNKQLSKDDQKIIKSKSYMIDKSVNHSIYTDYNNQNSSLIPIIPNEKGYVQSNTNFFSNSKQSKPNINHTINQRNFQSNSIKSTNGNNFDLKQKNNVISTVIQFKEAVGLLHYCRLIFRFITTLRKIKLLLMQSQVQNEIQIKGNEFLSSMNKNSQQEEILSRYLITVLDQLLKKIKQKGIIYQGDSYKKKQLKQTKLIEVAEEYFKKYVKQINKNRKSKQIIAVYDISTSLQFFKTFSGEFLFNLQKLKQNLNEKQIYCRNFGQNSKISQMSTQVTNICYLGIRLCESTQVIVRCFLHKNYEQLSKLTIQNWLAQQNYTQKQYQACQKQRQKSIKLQITLLKGSQTNDTQQNNRNYEIQ